MGGKQRGKHNWTPCTDSTQTASSFQTSAGRRHSLSSLKFRRHRTCIEKTHEGLDSGCSSWWIQRKAHPVPIHAAAGLLQLVTNPCAVLLSPFVNQLDKGGSAQIVPGLPFVCLQPLLYNHLRLPESTIISLLPGRTRHAQQQPSMAQIQAPQLSAMTTSASPTSFMDPQNSHFPTTAPQVTPTSPPFPLYFPSKFPLLPLYSPSTSRRHAIYFICRTVQPRSSQLSMPLVLPHYVSTASPYFFALAPPPYLSPSPHLRGNACMVQSRQVQCVVSHHPVPTNKSVLHRGRQCMPQM